MSKYIKFIVYIITSLYILSFGYTYEAAIALLVLLIVASTLYLSNHKVVSVITIMSYCLLILINPLLRFGLPLLSYLMKHDYEFILIILAFVLIPFDHKISLALLSSSLFIQSYYVRREKRLLLDIQTLKDTRQSDLIVNKQLEDNLRHQQVSELETIVLSERNRIARDIHDNVGHLLTGSLLQVGALMLEIDDKYTRDQLSLVKSTLDRAMTSVRESVHDLYEESQNLEKEVSDLLSDDYHVDVDFKYNIVTEPSFKIHSSFVFIIKEAINNIIKHSNATHVNIVLDESKDRYLLIIEDNGTIKEISNHKGIGVMSIEKRVEQLDGIININTDDGYRIYINVQKETL